MTTAEQLIAKSRARLAEDLADLAAKPAPRPRPRPGFEWIAEPVTDHPERYGPTPYVHHTLGCKGSSATAHRVAWRVVHTDDVDGLIECGKCLRMPGVRRALNQQTGVARPAS